MWNKDISEEKNKNLREKVLEKLEEERIFVDEEKLQEFNKKLQLIFA
jgi:hypothetical protein